MNRTEKEQPSESRNRETRPAMIVWAVVSVTAMLVVFFVSSTAMLFSDKIIAFSVVVSAYLLIFSGIYYWQARKHLTEDTDAFILASKAEQHLLAFDEAGQYFGGALKRADMFRLVASRIEELFPFQSSALFLPDVSGERLLAVEATGKDHSAIAGKSVEVNGSLTGRSFTEKRVIFGRTDTVAANSPTGNLPDRAVVAIPLCRGDNVFGVLQLFLFSELKDDSTHISLFEAVGARTAPMIFGSIELERGISNALTDPVTMLPNERAFYLILENQVAESQRKRDERFLTILAMDVKNLEETSRKYGQAAGDRLLNHVADCIRTQLRQMDFLASGAYDEFLIILPTANEEVSWDVMARIQTAFYENAIKINDTDYVRVEFNYGWGSFWKDGETAERLLKIARQRKLQSKSSDPQKVLWFPHDLAS